jgi:Uma2 family endonuclease
MEIDTTPMVEVRKKLTPDDVWCMQQRGELGEKGWELVDGEVIEVPPASFEHGGTAVDVLGPIWVFARKAGGRVLGGDAGFLVGSNFQQVRSPDISYIAAARDLPPDGPWFRGAPDLDVEVLSEGEHGQAYAQPKIREYFEAGAQLVWFVDLRRKEVRVYRPNSGEYTILRGEAVLTLEPIIAGFELRVADIFR